MFVRVWEYRVDPDHVTAFVAAYGPAGDWSRLFRQADGYHGTELYQDTDVSTRFLTVDRWASAAAWEAFLARYGEEYAALDARTAGWSTAERELVAGTGPTPP